MKVFEVVAETVRAEGAEFVFGVMGDGNLWLWDALSRVLPHKVVPAWHEAGAMCMADGYNRSTGRVGVATVTHGPGLTNCATTLVNSVRNRSSLVLLAGAVAEANIHDIQKLDQRRFIEACGARYLSVAAPDRAREVIREAFLAASAQRIPVVVDLPVDVQDRECSAGGPYITSAAFATPAKDMLDTAALERAAALLRKAERPVFIAGRGAGSPEAKAAILELAELSGALVATTIRAKGLFSGQPFDLGFAGSLSSAVAEPFFNEADLVIGFGAAIGYYTSGTGDLFPKAKLVRVDIDPVQHSIAYLPGLYVRADAAVAARAMAASLRQSETRRKGYRTEETRAALARTLPMPPRAGDGVDPRRLMLNLGKALPQHLRITCGAGHFFYAPIMYLPLPEGCTMEFLIEFGSIGLALSTGIGAAFAGPGRPNLVIEGDGSLMQSLQELETVARLGLQMTVLILNDSSYGGEVKKLHFLGMDETLPVWTSPDFVGVARSLGGDGVVLRDEADIGAAMEAALAKGGLYVIDARISPSTMADTYNKKYLGRPIPAPILGRP